MAFPTVPILPAALDLRPPPQSTDPLKALTDYREAQARIALQQQQGQLFQQQAQGVQLSNEEIQRQLQEQQMFQASVQQALREGAFGGMYGVPAAGAPAQPAIGGTPSAPAAAAPAPAAGNAAGTAPAAGAPVPPSDPLAAWGRVGDLALEAGVRPQMVAKFKEPIYTMAKNDADIHKMNQDTLDAQAKLEQANVDYIGTAMADVQRHQYDPNAFAGALIHGILEHPNNAVLKAQLQGMLTRVQQDPSQLKGVVDSAIGASKQAQDLTREQQSASATEAEAGARAKQAAAEAAKTDLETELTQQKLDLYKTLTQTPEALHNRVAASIDPTKYPALFARAFNEAQNAPDLEGVNKAIQTYAQQASEQERTVATETNPDVIGARVRQRVAEAQATAPIDVSKAVQTEIQKAKLAPGAVSGILDPALQRKVIDDQVKAASDYRGKQGDAQRLQDFVDASRSGNQAASAMIPIAELREIVNRVNMQELQAAGGGTSVARRVQNWLSKNTEGKPSDATLNDIQALGNIMQNAAKTTYRGKITDLNALGAKFDTEPAQIQTPRTAQPGQYKAGDTRTINRKKYVRDNQGNWNPQ